MPAGFVGKSFTATESVAGGTAPYNFSLSAGSLPPGLSLAPTGSAVQITGTPTQSGAFNFTVTITDSASPAQTATQAVTITIVNPATYYVAMSGSDSNPCSSSQPCATIAHAASLMSSGSSISVHAGIYREHPDLSSLNGLPGAPLILQAYGDGEVILDGSTAVAGWTAYSGSVYQANPGFVPVAVVVDNVPLTEAAVWGDPEPVSSVSFSASQWFYDTNSGILYVETADGSSPASHDVVVIDSSRTAPGNPNLFLDTLRVGNYWNIQSITIRGAQNYGLEMGSHAVLNNSKVWFNHWTGTSFGTNSAITNNTVAWSMMDNWPRGRCFVYNANQASVGYANCWLWGGWGGGLLVGGGNSTVTGNTVYMNGGEGLISYKGAGNNYIHGNTVYDNWSMNVYLDSEPNDTVDGNLVYSHDPTQYWVTNSGGGTLGTRFLRPNGVGIAEENYGQTQTLSMNHTVTNNVVVGCRRGIGVFPQDPFAGMVNDLVAHNTIVLPATNGDSLLGQGNYYIAIYLIHTSVDTGSAVRDNIVYGQGSTNRVLNDIASGGVNLSGVTIDHNQFYHPTNSTPFGWQDPNSGDQAYATEAGLGLSGDFYGDPLLLNATSFIAYPDKTISSGSPAKGAGSAISGVATDYNGFPYASPPSIGAFEFGSVPQ